MMLKDLKSMWHIRSNRKNEESWTKLIRKSVPELDNQDPEVKPKVPVYIIKVEDCDTLSQIFRRTFDCCLDD